MRWPILLLVLIPVVISIHACGDANQSAPSILQHQPDVPSIGDREYRNRDPFSASGGSFGTGGGQAAEGSGGHGGNASQGGQGGEAFGGAGGEESR